MGVISLPSPSMALNAWNMSGIGFPRYKLYNSWAMSRDETVEHIAAWTATVARAAPGGKLRALVVNSHGGPGRARLSGPAVLDASTAPKFSTLNGLVKHILISACNIVSVTPDSGDYLQDPGVRLLASLARATGANVYAPTKEQHMDVSYFLFGGIGDVDDFEGMVLKMNPKGQGAWLEPEHVSYHVKST